MFRSCYLPEIRTTSQLNRVVQYLKRISLFFKHSWHVFSCILENDHRNSSSNIVAEKSTLPRKFKHFVLFRCTTKGIRKPHSKSVKSRYYSILCNMPASPQRSSAYTAVQTMTNKGPNSLPIEQCWNRWSLVCPINYTEVASTNLIVFPHFVRSSTFRIFTKASHQQRKATLCDTSACQMLLQGKLMPNSPTQIPQILDSKL